MTAHCPRQTFRVFPPVTEFVELFRRPMLRRPFLAIVGGTRLGKSMLAAHVLQLVAATLKLPSFLEVTVEDDENMDFSEFDLATHAGVLLDGVGDVKMLKHHREALQGRAKKCRGGKSATMMYSYSFSLCRRAVVATLDLSAKNLHMLKTDHWLSNTENVIVLELTTTAWQCASSTAPMMAPSMENWGVEAVANWLEAADMVGPAAYLRSQGVTGQDLMSYTSEPAFAGDLALTPFVARKVLRLRDEHLSARS